MGTRHPVILFDGVCNLCNGAVQFVIRRDRSANFQFAPLQSAFGESVIQRHDFPKPVADSIVLVDAEGIWQKSDAILRIARKLPGGWPLLYGFIILPKFIRDGIYDWIARNRYRFFGRQLHCMIPTPELRARFLA